MCPCKDCAKLIVDVDNHCFNKIKKYSHLDTFDKIVLTFDHKKRWIMDKKGRNK